MTVGLSGYAGPKVIEEPSIFEFESCRNLSNVPMK